MGQGDHHDGPFPEGDDDGPDDARSRGAPPDPLDRVWVHPTELPGLAAGFTAPPPPSSSHRRSRWWAGPVAAGAAGALVTVVVLSLAGVFDRTTSNGSSNQLGTAATPSLAGIPDAAAHVGLSVVAVSARDGRGLRRASGVCIRHGGEVLTTATVVGDAKTVDIETNDGVRRTARVAGRDRTSNLALLAFDDATEVPAAQIADHAPVAGNPVWVIGAGDGTNGRPWVSGGMLASTDAVLASASGPLSAGLFETDAASGDGGMGGALVDRDGNVVAVVIGGGPGTTTTYAVPIATAVAIGEELRVNGVATHGSAGFSGRDGPLGPTVAAITPDGPAARAGLHLGDVVEAMNGRTVDTTNEVMALVRSGAPGEIVTLELRRGAADMKVQFALASEKG